MKSCCNLKKSFFVLNATAESVDCSLVFEKYSETFLQFDLQKKNIVKHITNLPQHLLKKIIGDNSSITDIASKIKIYRVSVSLRVF